MKLLKLMSVMMLLMSSVLGTAHAYNYLGKWAVNNVTMRAASGSFPVGNSYRTALGTVVGYIANNPSEAWITQLYDDTSVAFNNGQNEIWFSSSSTYSPAVTYYWKNGAGDLVETDVVFYNGVAYTTSTNKTSLWPWGGAYRPFQTTLMHEYGHVLGLAHENGEYNIMGQDWDHIHLNGSTARSYLGEDAADGLVDQYGTYSSLFEDISMSMFKYSGVSGEYSTHTLCQVYTTGGVLIGSTAFNGQRRYNVTKGTTYNFEFTYENNGASYQSVRAGYYLSTNSTISTGDRLLATHTFGLGRADVLTYKRGVAIPTDLTSGVTYYLGVIIDDNSSVSEVDEVNNASYHIIRIN